MDPLSVNAGNVQTISQFINSIDKAIKEMENFRWEYGDSNKLIETLKGYVSEAEMHFRYIRKTLDVVGKEQYLLANAIETTLQAFKTSLSDLYIELRLYKPNEASNLFYEKISVIGKYLLQYSEQLQKQAILDNQEQYTILMAKNDEIKKFQAIAVFFGLIVGTFVILNLTHLLQFMNTLSKESKMISQGNFDNIALDESRNDEIGDMAKTFNEMKASMKNQVTLLEEKNKVENELYKKENETLGLQNLLEREKLQQLRSQINPHFLFNTLNVIKLTAAEEDAKKTSALLTSLSKLYRFALASNDNLVLLSHEIQIVNEFYSLYKARFADRMKIKWFITPQIEITETLVPSFILQPIVENSFKDGLSPKEQGGTITIYIGCDGTFLTMEVKDDGVGMDEETLFHIKEKMKNPPNTGEHIGLYNIAARLKLLGNGSGMEINSKKDEGTTVTIKLPYITDVEKEEDENV